MFDLKDGALRLYTESASEAERKGRRWRIAGWGERSSGEHHTVVERRRNARYSLPLLISIGMTNTLSLPACGKGKSRCVHNPSSSTGLSYSCKARSFIRGSGFAPLLALPSPPLSLLSFSSFLRKPTSWAFIQVSFV